MHVAGKVFMAVMLLGAFGGGKLALKGLRPWLEASNCAECLANGKDYCIGENRCTERATLTCDGPEDHITGDKEFSLHGNPDAIHSMVCPADRSAKPSKDYGWPACAAAKSRCVKDGKRVAEGRCATLWEKCGEEVHAHDWDACAAAKTRCMKDGEKVMGGHCGATWEKCGGEMREHEWQACGIAKAQCMKKGEKDKAGRCGSVWEKCGEEVRKHGWESCATAKSRCMKGGEKVMEGFCGPNWEKCGEEVKSHESNAGVDTKDCFFDAECHEKVDWKRIATVKKGFFERLKLFKTRADAHAVKRMLVDVHQMFAQAGMPDDRIDYILYKWVKSVYPDALKEEQESKEGRKEKNDVEKDCYFDEECDKKVDRDKIGELKKDFFARLKVLAEHKDEKSVKNLIDRLHPLLAQAGLPEDRIDYMMYKWADAIREEHDACSKYGSLGETAVKGCHECASWYQGRVDQCMDCGKKCSEYCPAGSTFDCYSREPFVGCDKQCMQKNEEDPREHVDEIPKPDLLTV